MTRGVTIREPLTMNCEDRVFLIENSEAHAQIAQRALDQAGVTSPTDVFTDAESALDQLFTARDADGLPFLVLLSLTLPGIDGLDALRALHAAGITESTTIVVTSRVPDRTLRQRCLDLGAAAYLVETPTLDDWAREFRALPAVRARDGEDSDPT